MKQPDRVRESTAQQVNRQIDRATHERLTQKIGASKLEISRRIDQLDEEWDIERTLETNASIIGLSGLLMALKTRDHRWLAVPGLVFTFLLQHVLQGWSPPMEVFRRMGIRTRQEIDRERYALKVLRGDFNGVHSATNNPDEIMQAVKR